MSSKKSREINRSLLYTNKVNYFLSPHNGVVPALVDESQAEKQVTTSIFVDFLRTDPYTELGSRTYPFKTLAAAYASAELTVSDSNPKILVLLSGNVVPENITFQKGHIFLIGENSSGTHAPIVFTGSLTIIGPSASISSNHFAITGLQLLGVSGTNVITFSGTNPQRLFMRDVWITANGTCHGITMTNNGSGSSLHTNDCKFSHNGSGHYHCLNITAGTANIDTSESSGATVGIVGIQSGSCNISNSDIQSAGDYAIDIYDGGVLSVANSKITTTKANSIGISITSATAIAIVGNVSFSVPASATTGRAISGVASNLGYGLYYGPMYFLPDGVGGITNSKIDTVLRRTVISTTITLV
jgi:hypothetical protein